MRKILINLSGVLFLTIVLSACASYSQYMVQLDDTTSLKMTEINSPNPVSPTTQYTVLWMCEDEKCNPVAVNHVSSHGWLVGLASDAITATGYALNGWFQNVNLSSSATQTQDNSTKGGKK
jgi:hypothetical protein